jgi:hypothetical protein
MSHPLVDLERNLLCAAILLAWAGILLSISAVSPFTKLACLIGLLCVLVHHVRRKQLSYTITIGAIAATAFLYLSDPLYLPQTLCLIGVALVLATLFLFVPIETMFVVMVVGLALAYTLLLTMAVALRTDTAFTSLFFLGMCTLWLLCIRPAAA